MLRSKHVPVAEIHLLKTPVHFFFLAESLDGRHPGDVFLQAGVEAAEYQPAFAINLAGAPPVKTADIKNRRESGQANQRQFPVEP